MVLFGKIEVSFNGCFSLTVLNVLWRSIYTLLRFIERALYYISTEYICKFIQMYECVCADCAHQWCIFLLSV